MILNEIEDAALGAAHWTPPRTFMGGALTERLYPSYPESMHPVDGWPSVTLLVHSKQLLFISSGGAIEVQDNDDGSNVPYEQRKHLVIFKKADAWGLGVWDRVCSERVKT